MSLRQLGTAVYKYLNYEALPPSASDISTELKVGVKAIQAVIDKLREAEASIAKMENDEGTLSGDVEMDEHAIRTFHISAKNKHYQHLIPDDLKEAGHKYFLVHMRVIGMRKRGGRKLYLKLLPYRPVAPGSRPPPLTNEELLESKLLDQLTPGTKVISAVVYTDGAQAYQSVIAEHYPGLISKTVSHSDMEFTRKLKWFKKGHSTVAGTQCIDSTWGALDQFINDHVKTKADHQVNERLLTYIWSGLCRMNHREDDGLSRVGAAMKNNMNSNTE